MKYQKTEIATSMLETAIELFLDNKCKFSALHLAAASEEVMAGLINANKPGSITGREEAKKWLIDICGAFGKEMSAKEAGDSLNEIRNNTKHHDNKNDSEEIEVACITTHAKSVIGRAILNYKLLHDEPNENIERFLMLYSRNQI
jgi:hypothetical protein